MDNSASGFASPREQVEDPAPVALDVVSYGNPVDGESVTRRRALKGGAAALIGAAVAGAGATNVGVALANTAKKKTKKPAAKSKQLIINVNGKDRVVKSGPDSMLLYVLRNEYELHGPRFGCGLSQCGACAVSWMASRFGHA